MGQESRILTVFVSSPSGLEAERKAVRDVLAQLNVDLGTTFGLYFSVMGSDTHAVPGIGSDPQDVINQQQIDNTDIYVGIMWHRYGTSTPRAGSGTHEEFDRALRRRPKPHILVYFKSAAVPLQDIQPDQLIGVRTFRNRVKEAGALYCDFVSLDEFKTHLRTHFTNLMAGLGTKRQSTSSNEQNHAPNDDETSDLGLIDYLDTAWTQIPAFRDSTTRILRILKQMISEYRRMKTDFPSAPMDYGDAIAREHARVVCDRTAAHLSEQVAAMHSEIPRFRQCLREGVDAMTRALVVGTEDRVAGAFEQLPVARALYDLLSAPLTMGNDTFAKVRETMDDTPRMTLALNEAQRRTTVCLSELGDAFAEARRILTEGGESLERVASLTPSPTRGS